MITITLTLEEANDLNIVIDCGINDSDYGGISEKADRIEAVQARLQAAISEEEAKLERVP